MSTLEQTLEEQAVSYTRIDFLLDRIQEQLELISKEIKKERYYRFVEEVLDKRVK